MDYRLQSVYMTAELSPGTLCYSWGSIKNGKLGTSTKEDYCERTCGFYQQDLEREAVLNHDLLSSSWYTFQPQPIVHLLGQKMRSLKTGKQHILGLASNGMLFTWGDNSKSQLGLDTLNLIKANQEQVASQHTESQQNDEDIEYILGSESDKDQRSIKYALTPFQVTTKPGESSVSQSLSINKNSRLENSIHRQDKVHTIACGEYNSYAIITI